MAEGLAKNLLPRDWKIYSAGTRADGMNKYAIKVMKEIGIDITNQYSKTTEALKDITPDLVITLCDNAKQTCPVFLGKAERLHWGLEDPADAQGSDEEILDKYRKTRDEIQKRIKNL